MPLTVIEAEQLSGGAQHFGIRLLPDHIDALGRYLDLLEQWRVHARLISRRQTRPDLIAKHVIDAFALIGSLAGRRRIADVGSGAGFPGIPIAVVLPESDVMLIEVNRRKANFLREVVRRLGLTNARVMECRADDIQADASAQRFDAVVSRAVWSVTDLVRRAGHLVAPGGVLIAMKGPAVREEVARLDLATLRFSVQELVPYMLVSGEKRFLLLLRPTCST